ncbi:hypothetical protein LXL04_032196 [Taraxacum kok-saghyz]
MKELHDIEVIDVELDEYLKRKRVFRCKRMLLLVFSFSFVSLNSRVCLALDFQQLVSELKARLGLRVSFDQACPEMVMEDGKGGCGLVFLIGRKVSRSKLEGQQVGCARAFYHSRRRRRYGGSCRSLSGREYRRDDEGWSPEKGNINRVAGKSIGKDPSKHGFGFGSLQEVTNRRDPLKRVAWIRFVLQMTVRKLGKNNKVDLDEDPRQENTDVEHDTQELDSENKEDVDVGFKYSMQYPNMKWNEMQPISGERYESPHQRKLCLNDYSINNGYQIRLKE